MKYIAISIIFLFLSCVNINEKKIDINKEVEVKNDTLSLSFLEKIIMVDRKKDYLKSIDSKVEATAVINYMNDSIYNNKKKLSEVVVEINNCSCKNELFKMIDLYSRIQTLVDYPFTNQDDTSIYFEEVLYSYPEKDIFFKKFLNHPDQNWESLDLAQSLILYEDFIFYLIDLSDEERLTEVIQFYTKYQSLANEE